MTRLTARHQRREDVCPDSSAACSKHVVGHVRAVDGVSFGFWPGERWGWWRERSARRRWALHGPRQKPTAGEICTMARRRPPRPAPRRDRFRRAEPRGCAPIARIQMIFQDRYSPLNPRMTVLDIVSERGDPHPQALQRPSWPRSATAERRVGAAPGIQEPLPKRQRRPAQHRDRARAGAAPQADRGARRCPRWTCRCSPGGEPAANLRTILGLPPPPHTCSSRRSVGRAAHQQPDRVMYLGRSSSCEFGRAVVNPLHLTPTLLSQCPHERTSAASESSSRRRANPPPAAGLRVPSTLAATPGDLQRAVPNGARIRERARRGVPFCARTVQTVFIDVYRP